MPKIVASAIQIGQNLRQYRIVSRIGEGGMGVVYLAHDERLDRDVALKFLPAGALAEDLARRRFRNEALALAKLNHPNIATLYDFDTQDSVDFLVTEYIPGLNLSAKLAGGPLSEKELIRLAGQFAEGLASAHAAGVVHCDLKPANIRITPDARLKILDFGLAKLLWPSATASTESVLQPADGAGTLPYISPEQLKGHLPDARSDVYSAGTVLYEMASGKRTFPESSPYTLMQAILSETPPAPRELNRELSPEAERIILKCLDKDPDHRYQSAVDLCVDLRRLATPTTTTITRPLPTYRNRWKKMAWPAVVTVGLIAAIVALDVGGLREALLHRFTSRITSIAVLPLENLSGDPQQEYFADGMTEALISDLAQISALRVISRTSSMSYKGAKKSLREFARELNVDAVVEGTVQRSEGRVKIHADLIRARSDQPMWGKSYEQDARDVLKLQDDVARAIAGEIQIKLTAQEKARLTQARVIDPKVHELYLLGRYYWNKRTKDGLLQSIHNLQQAIERDPNYALAYAALADSYNLLPDVAGVPSSEAFPQARAAALKALDLQSDLAEAHTALASVKEDYDWDWTGAEQAYKQAISLNPGYEVAHAWYSNLLVELGRMPEALAEAKKAQELDPLSGFINANLAAVLYFSGEYEQAIDQCLKTLAVDPGNARAHRNLARVYLQQHLYPKAVLELNTALALSPENPEYLSELGYTFGVSGRTQEARAVLNNLREGRKAASPFNLAVVHMGLGEKDQALELLQKAVQQKAPSVVTLKVSPIFESLRSDPRFHVLLRKVGVEI
jgi:serine/threonine-protein kinase